MVYGKTDRAKGKVAIVLAAATVVGTGVWLQALAGAPKSAQMLQVVGGAVALVLIGLVPAMARRLTGLKVQWAIGLVGLGLLILPLFQPAMEGVHRWFWLGPVAIQPLPLALPLLVWLAAGDDLTNADWMAPGPICLAVAAVVLAVQPDPQGSVASLVVSLAMLLPFDFRGGVRATRRWLLAALLLGAWAVAGLRAVYLEPVAWVEGVIQLALQRGTLTGTIAVGGLIASVALIAACAWIPGRLLSTGRSGLERTGWLLAVGWAAMVAISLRGEYPVPVIGYGASWVIGWGLTLGLARAMVRVPKPMDARTADQIPPMQKML